MNVDVLPSVVNRQPVSAGIEVPPAFIVGICLPFIVGGIAKLADPAGAAAEVAGLGLPLPQLTAYLTIALQLGGSFAAVFMGRRLAALGALALAVFTIAATLLAHSFWTFAPPLRAPAMNAFVEHLAIVSALLLVAWSKWCHSGDQDD